MRSLRIFIVEALTCVCVAFSTYANEYDGLKYEKIMLTMDLTNGMAGDTINVEGSLIDASNGDLLAEFSRYVYLDLINPLGSVECRKKLRVDTGQFKGYIPVPADCAEGIYTLAAYTMFMQNFPSKFFYRTQLPIANPLTSKYRVESDFADGVFTAQLVDRNTGSPMKCSQIEILGDGKSGEGKNSDYKTGIKIFRPLGIQTPKDQ